MPTITRCRVASDVDLLSKVQLEEVSRDLKAHHPKLAIEPVEFEVSDPSDPDSTPNSPVRVARLMRQLLDNSFDALVIGATYVPGNLTSGLTIGAITNRLNPYDVIVSCDRLLDELPENARLIANDLRRESQLRYYRSDLRMVRSKGSVDSLIQKVRDSNADAAVLAAGDVERLHKQDYVMEFLTCSVCIPAAGQGSLSVIVRSSDDGTKKSVRAINDPASYSEVVAEWAFLDALHVRGDAPVAVLGSLKGKQLKLEGMIAAEDGGERIHSVARGPVGHEAELGQRLAAEIMDSGGRELLQELDLS